MRYSMHEVRRWTPQYRSTLTIAALTLHSNSHRTFTETKYEADHEQHYTYRRAIAR
jgi:hypothetical protein